MPGFVFNGEKPSEDIVAGISQTLDEAGVPSILWSEALMTLYGVPTVVMGADFVLPDDKISTGYEALRAVGFLECSQFSECKLLKKCAREWIQAPTQHLHMAKDEVICLFKKSETLWDLSSFEVDSSNGELMFASESLVPHTLSRGSTTDFASHLYPVRIPTPACYLEAVIKLFIRHGEHRFSWTIPLGYMLEYVVGSDILEIEKHLRPEFRPVLRLMKDTRPCSNFMELRSAALEELDAILKKRSETVQEQSEQNLSTAT